MLIGKCRVHFWPAILAITANLAIPTSTPSAYGQTVDERVVSPALRISPLPKPRELEETDIFTLEECLSAPFRCIDGTGNNLDDPFLGAAGTQLLRHVDPDYSDKIYVMRAGPNPRQVSNIVNAQSVSIPNKRGASDMVWAWGQFIDHDIDLTIDRAEAENIPVPTGDPEFDPNSDGDQIIPFNRSAYDPGTGTSQHNPRQQINSITAFIDASNVYGSDGERAEAIRTVGGRLLTTENIIHGDLLPFNEEGLPNAGGPSSELFLAGDVRANEQVLLTALHTLFVREHNRLAEQIAADDPSLSPEQIYQKARRLVGAEIQSITYNEFLPALLGRRALKKYKAYNPDIDPGISNAFSTAAFRLGHSMLNSTLRRVDAQFNEGMEPCGDLELRYAFFAPDEIIDCGIASLLRGAVSQLAQAVDTRIIDDVRNFLFGQPGEGGFDLASLNIQRGRDHGIATFNDVRAAYGLLPVASFDELTSDLETSDRLASIYEGPDDCDAWICMLAEDHVRGALVGETIRTILIDQFERLRDGDRFYFERILTKRALRDLPTLSKILEMNAGITGISDPFHVEHRRFMHARN